MDYEEQADIQAGCWEKTDGVSKVDRKYSSGLGDRRDGVEERRGDGGGGVRAIKQGNKNELEKKRGKRGRLSKRRKVKETRRKTRGMMGGE